MDVLSSDTDTDGKLLAKRIGEIEAQLDLPTTECCSLYAQLHGLQDVTEQVRATMNILKVFDAVQDDQQVAQAELRPDPS